MKIEKIRQFAHQIIEKRHVECDFIEYKKSDIFKDKILKTACAYANNYMERELGLIFIGVEEVDDRETGEKAIPLRPVSGIPESRLENVENGLRALLSNINPKISYHLIDDTIDDRQYLIIAVDPGKNGPYMTSEKAEKDRAIRLKPGRYIRISRDTIYPSPVQEYELLKKFADYSFTSDFNETAEIGDLNFSLVREYLKQTGTAEDILAQTNEELIDTLHLCGNSDISGKRVKNFAVLMFTDRPADFIPEAFLSILWETDAGTDVMSQKIFNGPVWKQSEEALSYIRTNFLRSYVVRTDGRERHREIYNWPYTALQEIVRNAVLHKDYGVAEHVGVNIYHDRITVVNHNRPMPPVTILDMNQQTRFDNRRYINPELKSMFHDLKLIETFGSGIRRAKNAMKKNGSQQLFFEPADGQDDYTMAIIPVNAEYLSLLDGKDSEAVKKAGQAPAAVSVKPGSGEDLILKELRSDGSLTIAMLAERTGLSTAGVNYCIKRLKEKGLLERRGSRIKGEWIIL